MKAAIQAMYKHTEMLRAGGRIAGGLELISSRCSNENSHNSHPKDDSSSGRTARSPPACCTFTWCLALGRTEESFTVDGVLLNPLTAQIYLYMYEHYRCMLYIVNPVQCTCHSSNVLAAVQCWSGGQHHCRSIVYTIYSKNISTWPHTEVSRCHAMRPDTKYTPQQAIIFRISTCWIQCCS